ncbi:MAG: hypothetical protein AAFR61_19780 [Bacteroidota bacterium]
MSATLIPLIVGALIGIVPSLINKYFDTRNEQKRWEREQLVAKREKFQTQLSQTGRKLFTMQHTINWYVWLAHTNPAKIDTERLEKYDEEVHPLFPEVLGELVEIAVISPPAYEVLNNAFQELMDLDAIFAKRMTHHLENRKLSLENAADINELLDRVISAKDLVINKVKEAMNHQQAA